MKIFRFEPKSWLFEYYGTCCCFDWISNKPGLCWNNSYSLGYNSFLNGININPYFEHTQEYDDWQTGYYAAEDDDYYKNKCYDDCQASPFYTMDGATMMKNMTVWTIDEITGIAEDHVVEDISKDGKKVSYINPRPDGYTGCRVDGLYSTKLAAQKCMLLKEVKSLLNEDVGTVLHLILRDFKG